MKNWKTLADGVWEHSSLLKLPGGFYFPIKATAIRLQSGDLWLHSPTDFSAEATDELESLGDVRYIVSPNLFHHLYLEPAAERFPDAEVWTAPGLVAKKKKKLTKFHELSEPLPWSQEIDTLFLGSAPVLNESMFFHDASKSFLCTDMVFHINETRNTRTRWLLKMIGAHQKLTQSRSWRLFTKQRDEASKTTNEVLSWDFEHIVMGHGDTYSGSDARSKFADATTWIRGQKELKMLAEERA